MSGASSVILRPRYSLSSRAAMASADCGSMRASAGGAVLHAELHVEQPQEMIDLGERRHGALAAAAAGALLDGDRRRNAEDRVHVGTRGGLDELPRIGVQRLQVAALSLGEQDVEGQGALAAAGHAGDDGESVAAEIDVDVLEVVLARAADLDGVAATPAPAVRGPFRIADAAAERSAGADRCRAARGRCASPRAA